MGRRFEARRRAACASWSLGWRPGHGRIRQPCRLSGRPTGVRGERCEGIRGSPVVRLATIGAAAFFALIVLPRATLPMADGDAWWHIHAGEEVLATGQIADANTWTLAGEGFRWVSQDWLS